MFGYSHFVPRSIHSMQPVYCLFNLILERRLALIGPRVSIACQTSPMILPFGNIQTTASLQAEAPKFQVSLDLRKGMHRA